MRGMSFNDSQNSHCNDMDLFNLISFIFSEKTLHNVFVNAITISVHIVKFEFR